MKNVLISRLRKTFKLEDVEVELFLDKQAGLCQYWAKCRNKTNCSEQEDCKIKDFYNRYPNYEFLGIGAATEAPGRRYE